MGLILHAGAKEATLQEVEAIVTPNATATYWPVAHTHMLQTVKDRLQDQGMAVTREKYGLTRDGARFFGVLDTAHSIVPGVMLQVGVRNAHDRSLSRGCVMGEHVTNCDNELFTGELEVSARHSRFGEQNFIGRIERMLEKLAPLAEKRAEEIMQWQDRVIDRRDLHDLVLRAYNRGALRAIDIKPTLEVYDQEMPEAPTESVWRFVNAVTRVGKAWSQACHAKRTMRLTKAVRRYMVEA